MYVSTVSLVIVLLLLTRFNVFRPYPRAVLVTLSQSQRFGLVCLEEKHFQARDRAHRRVPPQLTSGIHIVVFFHDPLVFQHF